MYWLAYDLVNQVLLSLMWGTGLQDRKSGMAPVRQHNFKHFIESLNISLYHTVISINIIERYHNNIYL